MQCKYHSLFVDGIKADDVDPDFHFCRAICTSNDIIELNVANYTVLLFSSISPRRLGK